MRSAKPTPNNGVRSCLAIATLSGGVLGLIDLRLAYVFSLFSAITMGILAWRFTEPVHAPDSVSLPQSFGRVVLSCFVRLRDPVLGWIFAIVIVLYAMAHIVYEFYQPYISLLQLPLFEASAYAPLISGVVISISMFGGAIGARASIAWQGRLGLVGLLAVGNVYSAGYRRGNGGGDQPTGPDAGQCEEFPDVAGGSTGKIGHRPAHKPRATRDLPVAAGFG